MTILDLFSEATPAWSADAVCAALQVSTSTGYRYIRELSAAGLLTRIAGGSYVLGPKIVQLEALMRRIDPIARVGRAIILPMVRETGCDALLSNIYGEHVINVVHERGVEELPISYVRGRPHPLFRGAMSKAIVAFLPRPRAVRLYAAHAKEAAAAGLGTSWKEFRKSLQAIRARGYSESRGELDPEVVGFGVPVFNGEEVLGSVSLGCSRERLRMLNEAALIERLKQAATAISRSVEGISHPQTAVMSLNEETLRRLEEPHGQPAS